MAKYKRIPPPPNLLSGTAVTPGSPMKIKELRPRNKVPTIELLVVEKGEPRNFTSRNGVTGRVCDARGQDEDGETISVTLWNEEIEQVALNDRIRITDGWASEWQGNLQVSAGRYGQLEVLEK